MGTFKDFFYSKFTDDSNEVYKSQEDLIRHFESGDVQLSIKDMLKLITEYESLPKVLIVFSLNIDSKNRTNTYDKLKTFMLENGIKHINLSIDELYKIK